MTACELALRVDATMPITVLHPLDMEPPRLRECALCGTFWCPLILIYEVDRALVLQHGQRRRKALSEFKQHDNWSSRSTFLLAAVGAAVGLGNIWKFPYIAGANGGSAFVLVYLLCIAFIALPILIGEIGIGSMGRQSPPRASAIVAGKFGRSKRWSIVGWLGLLSAYFIATYYSVIAGWTMAYVLKSGSGDFGKLDAVSVATEFEKLQADPVVMTFWHGLFILITTAILARGLKMGIEKTVTFLMPVLFALLLLMVAYSYVEGDMAAGLNFLFAFKLEAINGEVFLMAIGHAFFSIGVAMGLMMGFGAYLGNDISIGRSAVAIVTADTMVALLAGIAIFPIVFANGLDPAQGPGLVFVSLPLAFGQMPGGLFFGTLFFILLFFAALTSLIGVLEPVVAWIEETTGWTRALSALSIGSSTFILGIAIVLSFNVWSEWYPLAILPNFESMGLFDVVDYVTANVMMPLGGMLLAVFVGWCIPKDTLYKTLGIQSSLFFTLWLWLLRLVAPLSILAVFISNL
jgi:NSS family neurotransmitter:Na+ symporter